MNVQHYLSRSWFVSISAVLVAILVYVLFEPAMLRSQSLDPQQDITVTQQITPEISMLLSTTTVVMEGALQGVTGGTATGTLEATVTANSGYFLTIEFENANPAMIGESSGSTSLGDHPAGPEHSFATGANARFGYTVTADDVDDLFADFRYTGITCGSGTLQSTNFCWRGASTTPQTIMSRGDLTGAGSTSYVTFRVHVPPNPSPALETDFYTATATLTATAQ